MDQRGTILPIAPDDVWPRIALLGLRLATGRIYWASTTIGKSGGAIPAFPAQRLFHRPRPGQRTFQWKVRRAVAGGRKPEGKGPSAGADTG
jgi:hypothetical protein